MAGHSPFLWLNNIHVCMYECVHHILFIYSSANVNLGCFHIFTIGNNAIINTVEHIFFPVSDFGVFGYTPRIGISGSFGRSIFNFYYK